MLRSVLLDYHMQVMRSSLTYDLTEYVGELYRMNLSCSDGRNGCLFFKVIGTTDIRNGQ